MTYTCEQEGRRQRLLEQTAPAGSRINALDYLIVSDVELTSDSLRQRVLRVHFLFPDHVSTLSPAHFRIEGGVREIDPPIRWAMPLVDINAPGGPGVDPTFDPSLSAVDRSDLAALAASTSSPDEWWLLLVERYGDFSRYTLRLDDGAGPPAGFDLRGSSLQFSFKVECSSPFDCEEPEPVPPAPADAPQIDYLARDFNSVRRMMVERLSRLRPGAVVDDVAGLDGAILDVLAHAVDHLSYLQDAVATEAYLGTARRRISARRHARLLGYRMHEGVNARVFVHFAVRGGVSLARGAIRAGASLATRIDGAPPVVDQATVDAAFERRPKIFATLHDSPSLRDVHGRIELHTWGNSDCFLPRGATQATLRDPGTLDLDRGDFLILERIFDRPDEALGPEDPRDPRYRYVVRLTEVGPLVHDTLMNVDVREVTWHEEDALPEDLWIEEDGRTLAVARGNIVLADYGERVLEVGRTVAYGVALDGMRKVRARLERRDVVFSEPFPEALDVSARRLSAQDPALATPDVALVHSFETWRPERDLIGRQPGDRAFVVEVENDGIAHLRFGDGVLGRNPGEGDFAATYRVGSGASGHVGAEAIAHLLRDPSLIDPLVADGLAALRNPLPSAGGIAPESIDSVKLRAPQAFRVQRRAVTATDWMDRATELEEVQRAAAYIQWTGAWPTVYLHLDLVDGRELDAATEEVLLDKLDPFRLTGYELELVGPVYVSLDIALTVCVETGHYREHVLARLTERFRAKSMSDGSPAFFHPDNFTFGQSVFLSQIVAGAMAIPGVRWIDTRPGIGPTGRRHHFKRWGRTASGELEAGRIDVGPLEIIRCDGDPNFPDRGRIQFFIQGGS